MTITGDQKLVKSINRMALVRTVRDSPGVSRADLAELCGLTKSTVSLLSKELIDEGWLFEKAALTTGALGRRPTPLYLESGRLAIIGAELGVDSLQIVVMSITGDTLSSRTEARSSDDVERVSQQLAAMIVHGIEDVKRWGRNLLGVGVGLPGLVDRHGVLRVAPNLGWRDVDVGEKLHQALAKAGYGSLEVQLQNEADVAALGEYEFGEQPAGDPLVYLSCGSGVGAGIVLNDRLFVGASGTAGEIGHTTLQLDGPACSCGRHGCAEAFIGLRAIGSQLADKQDKPVSIHGLKELLLQHDARAEQAIHRAATYLGVLMQNVWATFDPVVIVLGGEASELGEFLLGPARNRFEQFGRETGVQLPQIRLARYGRLATAAGAAALVLHSLLRPMVPQLRTPLAVAA